VAAQLPPPPNPDEPAPQAAAVSGEGHQFEIIGHDTLDVIVVSSQSIRAEIKSLPSTLSLCVEALDGAAATTLTLDGLRPTTSYWLYVDRLVDGQEKVTDATGRLILDIDLTAAHLLTLARRPSTRHIPSDTEIGTWDPESRVYTLTMDVSETVEIEADDITLEGAGYAITGAGSYGIYAMNRRDIVIRNVRIEGSFSYGIFLQNMTQADLGEIVVEWTTIAPTDVPVDVGIHFLDARSSRVNLSRLVIRNNDIIARQSGIWLRQDDVDVAGDIDLSSNSIEITNHQATYGIYQYALRADIAGDLKVADNYVTHTHPAPVAADYGIYVDQYHGYVAGDVQIVRNTVSSPNPPRSSQLPYYGMHVQLRGAPSTYGGRVDISDNTIDRYKYGLYLYGLNLTVPGGIFAERNLVTDTYYWGGYFSDLPAGATVRDNMISGRYGVTLSRSDSVEVEDNQVSADEHILHVQHGAANKVVANTLRATAGPHGGSRGIRTLEADGNQFSGNTIEGVGVAVDLSNSEDNDFYHNIFTGFSTPVVLQASTNNTFSQPLPAGGNYWATGTAEDDDDDGFADEPFDLGGIVDEHPWHVPTAWRVPKAQASDDQVLVCPANSMYSTLNAGDSIHPEGLPLSYDWLSDTGIQAEGEAPVVLLSRGVHVFLLTVEAEGYSATDTVVVEVLADTEPPQLDVSAPVADSWVGASKVTVEGTVHENYGLATIDVAGRNASFTAGTPNTFSRRIDLVDEGPNQVTIVATDIAGSSDSVTLNLLRDTTPPTLTISAPVSGSVQLSKDLVVVGTVQDLGAGVQGVTVNGVDATIVDGQWQTAVSLNGQGDRTLRVVATDGVGHRTRTDVAVVVDTRRPNLALDYPTRNAVVTPEVAVAGTVSDQASAIAAVSVNGLPALVAGSAFSIDLQLPVGDTTIVAIATDAAGHSDTVRVPVRVAAPAVPRVVLQLLDSEGAAMAGARVDLLRENGRRIGPRHSTDPTGFVQFDVDPEKVWQFRVRLAGADHTVPATTGDTVVVSTLRTGLHFATAVGTPVEGARVRLIDAEGSRVGERQSTDADGLAVFQILPGASYDYELTHLAETVTVAATGAAITELHAARTRLTVQGASGAPVEGVRVALLRPDSTQMGQRQDTEADGTAAFEILPGLPHIFKVTYRGAEWTSVLQPELTEQILQLEGSTLSLLNIDGQGLAAAKVRLLRADATRTGIHDTTDVNGMATIDVLPGAVHAFEVIFSAGTWTSEALIGGQDTSLTTARTRLVIRDNTGLPFPQMRVDLLVDGRHPNGRRVLTDTTGVAFFDVLPGVAHALRARHLRGEWVSPIQHQADTTTIALQTQQSSLTLTSDVGEPVAGARVTLLTHDSVSTGGRITTAEDGTARFQTLPGCLARFQIRLHGETTMTDLTPCGGTLDVNVAASARSVSLTFLDADDAPIEGAKVRLLKSDGRNVERVDTDSNGIARFVTLPEADHQLEVAWLGTRHLIEDLSDGEMTLHADRVDIAVVDAGQPLVNQLVRLRRSVDGGIGARARTNPEGTVRFDVLPGMEWLGEVKRSGVFHQTQAATGGGSALLDVGVAPAARVVAAVGLPVAYGLDANYPNPFNPSTSITFHLPRPTAVSLVIYDMLGQRIATLIDGERSIGTHVVTWDSRDDAGRLVAAGSYLTLLESDLGQLRGRMTLLK
ncbi:MAG: hypothetical protein HOH74_14750, partial [Gemmatimonadetes bacterium]|nr:hypothetical protein [Gemmatimonadota bacterium]